MSSFDPDPLAAAGGNVFVPHPVSGRDPDAPTEKFVAIRVGSEVGSEAVRREITAEEIRDQAYAEGVEAGRAELPWKEAEELRGAIETLEQALSGVADLRRDSLRDQRVAVVNLAIAIAERLVRHSIETDPEKLAAIVERAVATLPNEGKLRIAISADDYQVLQIGMAETLATFAQNCGAEIEACAELARGDVLVHGERGDVDARVASLLPRIRDALDELFELPEQSA